MLPHSPAAERNLEPLSGVLRIEFADRGRVFEIGSGTGQHAAGFAAGMPWLCWQPSDLPDSLPGLRARVAASGQENIGEPVEFDVFAGPLLPGGFDAAFSANTAHIMSEYGVERMFDMLAGLLVDGGRFCLYGPFREEGKFSTESNERFDAELRRRSPDMGIRDMESVCAGARSSGHRLRRRYAMPGNNLLLVFELLSEQRT